MLLSCSELLNMSSEYTYNAYGSYCRGWDRARALRLTVRVKLDTHSDFSRGVRRWVLWLDDAVNIFELVFQRVSETSYVIFEVNRKLKADGRDSSRALCYGNFKEECVAIRFDLSIVEAKVVVVTSFDDVVAESFANVSVERPEELFIALGSENCFPSGEAGVDFKFWLLTDWKLIETEGFKPSFFRLESRRSSTSGSLNLDLNEFVEFNSRVITIEGDETHPDRSRSSVLSSPERVLRNIEIASLTSSASHSGESRDLSRDVSGKNFSASICVDLLALLVVVLLLGIGTCYLIFRSMF